MKLFMFYKYTVLKNGLISNMSASQAMRSGKTWI